LGINQGKSLLKVMGELRRRVWQMCRIRHKRVHINMDTRSRRSMATSKGAEGAQHDASG